MNLKYHKKARTKLPTSSELVKRVIDENPIILENIKNKGISVAISKLRQLTYDSYLKLESPFNNKLIEELPDRFRTQKVY